VLVLLGKRGNGHPGTVAVGQHLLTALRAGVRGLPSVHSVAVGVGQPRGKLVDLRLSYDEATVAARVAAAQLPSIGPVASWSDLGIYRVLSQLSGTALRRASVHPGLERLLDDKAHLPLLETLETYLDLAGNAHATAERMSLHRTSLYYRLQRIEQLAGTDLRNGSERLCLHLALKLARLAGRYRPTGALAPRLTEPPAPKASRASA